MANENQTDWLQLARESFTDSSMYFDANVRTQVESALRLVQSKHPQGSKYFSDAYKARSRIFRPKTRSALRKNEAVFSSALFSNEDVVNVSAYNQTDAKNLAAAELMQEVIQYRLTNEIPWFLTAVGAFQEAQTNGVVASYQEWQFDSKRELDQPNIKLVPIENLRFHPSSDWTDPINTSPYLIELIPMYVKDVKARMKQQEDGQAKWKTLTDTELMASVTSQNDSIRLQRQGQARQDPQEASISYNPHQVVWVHRNIIEDDNGQDQVFYTLGTLHLLSDPKPLKDVYRHGIRPYTLGIGLIEAHKTYPESPVLLTKEIQGEINEIANQRIDNVRFAMNKRYFAKRGAQVDVRSLVRNVPSSVTLMNDIEKDVRVVETQDVTSSAYKEQEVLNNDFDDLLGIFSNSSVQTNRKLNETVGGMEMLSDNANEITEYQLRVFIETWVEPTLKQLVLLEQAYETDEEVLTIAGERAKLYKKYGIAEIDDDLIERRVNVKVNVGMGATNPEMQFNKFIRGINTALAVMENPSSSKLKTDEVIKEVMSKSGYKNSERFFIQAEEGVNPEVQALQEQVQALQQQLQAKMPKELLDATVRKLDAETDKTVAGAIETYVKANYGAMQAAQVVAMTPAVTPIADVILDGAGYVPKDGADITQLNVPDPMPALPQGTNEVPVIESPINGVNGGIETVQPDGIISEEFGQ